ncbi:hypothetical protein [Pseudoalteromonas piscicida]
MMINFELIANQIDLSAKQNIALKAGRSHRSVIQSLNTILPLRRKWKFHRRLTPPPSHPKSISRYAMCRQDVGQVLSGTGTCLTRRLHDIDLGFED